MMPDNIILIGMPGCGKSSIGIQLSQKCPDYTLYDVDNIIEKMQGKTINDIFSQYSEDYFRKLEYDTIQMLCNGNKKIISIGGGAFENPDTRSTLLNFGKVFYLKTDFDVLYYRISKDNTRPLLNCENPKEALKNLMEKRASNYQKAHFTIDVTDKNEDEVVESILEKINETNFGC